MDNDTRNYYERELDQIDFTGEHPAKILIGSEGKVTRTLDVNRESAAALVSKLCAVFFVDLTLATTMKAPEAATVQMRPECKFSFKKGMDRNGNGILKVKGGTGHGFSIPTNGNLPQTHRDGIGSYTLAEVLDYVTACGTARQRVIMGVSHGLHE